ncbi:MAG TPA: ATP synthase F1 subunit gamma [Verrucomicrobia bacterium]|nr:ATP synthase F1 subunit gamma [Verrucomicrobiota bacterium]HOP98798.1 ATP synthase F1 subunit gamma [Verrucomicrobiota bacterium]
MPSTRDIRRRIRSVKNTAQITKAMQMVAAAKMRKAQQAALAGRPYAQLMNQVLAEVTHHAADFTHPLLEVREVRKRAVILVSTDKGLCGSLNANLLREAGKFDRNTTVFITAGRKAAQFVARTRRQLAAEFTYKDAPMFAEARAISKFAQDMFIQGEVDHVDILYTNFISTLSQRPEVVPFLPVGEIKGVVAGVDGTGAEVELAGGTTEFQFEPSAAAVLGGLLPHYLNFKVYQILLEAKASEQSARMVAMKSATDNANQLIKDLTLEYNKMRQANITKELLEISSAAMAMG